MRKMRLPIISEQMASKRRFCLRVEMGEEIKPGIAQQEPVKKSDIEGFKPQKHDDESQKELPEAETDMQSVVLIGNSGTRRIGNYLVTERGYLKKYG